MAYVRFGDVILCNVHGKSRARRTKEIPVALPKDPALLRARREDTNMKAFAVMLHAAMRVFESGRTGALRCDKLGMFNRFAHHPGFLPVFPNNRSKASLNPGASVFGVAANVLSPMQLGPVEVSPGTWAASIENAHQCRKVFPEEAGSEGEVSDRQRAWMVRLMAMKTPFRHKPALPAWGDPKFYNPPSKSVKRSNIPQFSLIDAPGGEARITYMESRQFYCTWYEVLARKTEAYAKLRTLLRQGFSLCIYGFDGFDMGVARCGVKGAWGAKEDVRERIFAAYSDISRPFGHEAVLFTLLALPQGPYPWRDPAHRKEEWWWPGMYPLTVEEAPRDGDPQPPHPREVFGKELTERLLKLE